MDHARILCLDLGARRVGVAVSDPLGLTAQPLETITYQDIKELRARLRELLARYDPAEVVVGLPLTLAGGEGVAVRRVRKLLAQLTPVLRGRDLIEWDERLSTAAAERALLEGDVSRQRRKQLVDSVAASLILQGYMASRGR